MSPTHDFCGIRISENDLVPDHILVWFNARDEVVAIMNLASDTITVPKRPVKLTASKAAIERMLNGQWPSAPHDEAPDQFAENANCPIVGEAEVDRYER